MTIYDSRNNRVQNIKISLKNLVAAGQLKQAPANHGTVLET